MEKEEAEERAAEVRADALSPRCGAAWDSDARAPSVGIDHRPFGFGVVDRFRPETARRRANSGRSLVDLTDHLRRSFAAARRAAPRRLPASVSELESKLALEQQLAATNADAATPSDAVAADVHEQNARLRAALSKLQEISTHEKGELTRQLRALEKDAAGHAAAEKEADSLRQWKAEAADELRALHEVCLWTLRIQPVGVGASLQPWRRTPFLRAKRRHS